MARRSGRLSDITKREASKPNGATKRKRASPSESDGETTPRPTKRKTSQTTPRKSQSTPKKSPHFPKQEMSEATGLTSEDSEDDDEASAYSAEDDEESNDPSSATEDDSADDFSDSSAGGKGKKAIRRTSSAKTTPAGRKAGGKGAELWRQGADIDAEPGTEVIIKKPKARPAGNTPYRPEAIHPNTLLFLGDLKRINDREWLKMHDPDFRQAENDWKAFVEVLSGKLSEIDESIPELPVKDVIYRIYRDVRFSKDPTPYKPHFSAAWSRTGRKGPYAVYYLQIGQRGSYFGGGCWHPEASALARLRFEIDRRSSGLKDILMSDRLRKEFLGGAGKSYDKVVKAFVSGRTNKENALKSKPKGYSADHPDIALLKLRNFTLGRPLSDEEVLAPGFAKHLAELMGVYKPFIEWLNSVVMPDPDAEEEEEEEEEEDDVDDDEDLNSNEDQ